MARHYACTAGKSKPLDCDQPRANKICLKKGGGLYSPAKCKYLVISNS